MQPTDERELPLPGEVWVADHRKFDVMVIYEDRVLRPWVTAIADVGSAAWVGWRICLTPSSQTVCHALRSAILAFGPPKQFVWDNGKEFTANRFGGKRPRLERPRTCDLETAERWPAALGMEVETSGIWEALGVRLVTALPYNARAKPIEPMFGAWARMFENLFYLGWTGRDAQEKPEKLKAEVAAGRLLRFEEFCLAADGTFETWNREHPCGDRPAPPYVMYQDYVRPMHNATTLNFLLQDRRTNARVRGNTVTWHGQSYASTELARFAGCQVTLRGDTDEPEWISCMTHTGQSIALHRKKKATWDGFGEANKETRRARREQAKHLKAVAAYIEGAAPPERLDPLGTIRMVGERLAAENLAERERLALPEIDRLAQEQIEAQERAEAEAAEPEEKSRIYDDVTWRDA